MKLIVGLSGGADSVALLSMMRREGHDCVAVHCHFGLRGAEADRDLDFARAMASRLGAEFTSIKFDTRAVMAERGISAEMACRDLRYEFFEKTRREHQADYIAVAHHRDDNIETFFLNLMRGAGLHGLRGMLPESGRIIRPLLSMSRQQILRYLEEQGLDYVTDSTNAESDFTRNRLRNEVLPVLYRHFPDAPEAIARAIDHLRGYEALFNQFRPQNLTLDEIKRSAAPATLLHEQLAPAGFNSTQTEAMLTASSGAVFLSPTHRAEINYGRLSVMPLDRDEAPRPRLHGSIKPIGDFGKPQPGVLYLDSAAMDGSPRWELRPYRTGDRMRPFGMKGSKLLSDLFAAARLSASQRRAQYVLTRNDVIIWAVGLRASAHFPVTDRSTEYIEIHAET